MSERSQIDKGLKHLAGSEEIIGNIVAYCVNAHKADPSKQTMDKIKQYVSDTANSVCGHVLTIAHNINSLIDKESKQIEEMQHNVSYIEHRLNAHSQYMSQLYMTKFQTLPRPKPTIHILRQTIPNEKLPKYARPKKPWQRQGIFDYSILDQVGSKKRTKPTQSTGEGIDDEKLNQRKQKAQKQIQPKATVQSINPYENIMNSGAPSMEKQDSLSRKAPSSPIGKSLYKRSQERAKINKVKSSANVMAAPPTMSSAPPMMSSAPPTMSGAAPPMMSSGGSAPKSVPKKAVRKQVKKAPQQPPVAPKGPPAVPGGGGGGPPPIPAVPGGGGPPPVPGGGGPPPVPPVPGGGGPPPVPGGGGPPPVPGGGGGNDPRFAKYEKMKKIRMPMPSIAAMMRTDGMSEEEISAFSGM